MYTRRQFLSGGGACLAGAALPEAARAARAGAAPASAFGVQLYTVRQEVIAQPQRVLSTIRQIGYRCAETFGGEYTVSARELKALVTGAGLALPSAHFAYQDVPHKFDYAKELGVRYMVCGSTPVSVANSADGFKRAADQYNQWGRQANKLGLRFAFHNHNTEFQRFGDRTGLDILLQNTDPHLVQWQIDCYWAAEGGFDPVQLIRQHGKRLQSLHFKDRKPGFRPSTVLGKDAQHFTEIGTGTLNWPDIWKAASSFGVKYFFVEQDITEMPPLESLRISYRNLVRLLG